MSTPTLLNPIEATAVTIKAESPCNASPALHEPQGATASEGQKLKAANTRRLDAIVAAALDTSLSTDSNTQHSNSGECTSAPQDSNPGTANGHSSYPDHRLLSCASAEPPCSGDTNNQPAKDQSQDQRTVVTANTVSQDDDSQKPQETTDNSRPKTKLPRPETNEPCPRCGSSDTKFCYYNNYNVKQPRFFCKSCQRYWTAGGTLRNVPPGSGRRKSKSAAAKDAEKHALNDHMTKQHGNFPLPSSNPLSAYPPLPPLLADPMLAYNAAAGNAQQQALLSPTLSGLKLPTLPTLPGQWPGADLNSNMPCQQVPGFDPRLLNPAGLAPHQTLPNPAAPQPNPVQPTVAEDGSIDGRRLRFKGDPDPAAAAASFNPLQLAALTGATSAGMAPPSVNPNNLKFDYANVQAIDQFRQQAAWLQTAQQWPQLVGSPAAAAAAAAAAVGGVGSSNPLDLLQQQAAAQGAVPSLPDWASLQAASKQQQQQQQAQQQQQVQQQQAQQLAAAAAAQAAAAQAAASGQWQQNGQVNPYWPLWNSYNSYAANAAASNYLAAAAYGNGGPAANQNPAAAAALMAQQLLTRPNGTMGLPQPQQLPSPPSCNLWGSAVKSPWPAADSGNAAAAAAAAAMPWSGWPTNGLSPAQFASLQQQQMAQQQQVQLQQQMQQMQQMPQMTGMMGPAMSLAKASSDNMCNVSQMTSHGSGQSSASHITDKQASRSYETGI